LPFAIIYFLHTTALSLTAIGAALTTARLLALPAPVLAGSLIDRFGSRRVFAAGDLVGAAGFIGYLFVGSAWELIAAAFVVSAGQAIFWTASRSLVRQIAEVSERPTWFALQAMTRNAGFGLGGIIGAVAVSTGARWVYLMFAGLNAVSFVVAAALILRWQPSAVVPEEESPPAAGAGPRQLGYFRLLKDRGLAAITGINLAFVMCSNVLNVLLLVYITTVLGKPAWLGGAVFTVNTILVSVAQAATTRGVRRFSDSRVLQAAAICWALSFLLLWGFSVAPKGLIVPGLFLAIVVFTLAEMLQGPAINTAVVSIAPPGASGRYAAVFQLSWSLGSAVAPLLLTWLLSQGVRVVWTALLAVCALAVLGVQFTGAGLRPKSGNPEPENP
jgi:MFS family permease